MYTDAEKIAGVNLLLASKNQEIKWMIEAYLDVARAKQLVEQNKISAAVLRECV